jgi:hypothetical protein
MRGNDIGTSEMAKWDPVFSELVINVATPVVKRWFRAEVRGMETFPPDGGVLLVSNHSGATGRLSATPTHGARSGPNGAHRNRPGRRSARRRPKNRRVLR